MNGFHHVAMKVFDFDKTVAFYTEGLGFEKGISWGEGSNRAIMINIGGGSYLEIFAGGKKAEDEDGVITHIAFKSKNCDEDLQRAVNAGASVTLEAQNVDIASIPVNPVRIAFCKEPAERLLKFLNRDNAE